MNVFIFQCLPDRYDLRSTKSIKPAKEETWYATRYRKEMNIGDLVFFWMAGEEKIRGLYGWGRISSTPYIIEEWSSHGVNVINEVKFSTPILSQVFREDKVLAEMLILRVPQATNFLLSRDEAKILIKIVEKRSERPPTLEEVI